jgi:hypothetical protein
VAKDDSQAVSSDENTLRRVPNKNQFYESWHPIAFARAAFQPSTERDTDGLSVFRESFTSARMLAFHGRAKGDCFVVRLNVADIEGTGLSVVAAPDPDQLPGHALIPELAYSIYKRDKQKAKLLMMRLAELASKPKAIAYYPPDHPDARVGLFKRLWRVLKRLTGKSAQ